MRFSRTLAWIFGIGTPLVETLRRWGTWLDFPPATLDDYLLGALLIAGAWASGRHKPFGDRLLAAAWGFTCGMGYSSTFMQWQAYRLGIDDPAPIPTFWVFMIKAVGTTLAAVALWLTIRGEREKGVAA
jgi:hypothetical protein